MAGRMPHLFSDLKKGLRPSALVVGEKDITDKISISSAESVTEWPQQFGTTLKRNSISLSPTKHFSTISALAISPKFSENQNLENELNKMDRGQLISNLKVLTNELKEKERDLQLSAEIGHNLLLKNQELEDRLKVKQGQSSSQLSSQPPKLDDSYLIQMETLISDLKKEKQELLSGVSKARKHADTLSSELQKSHENYEKKCNEVEELKGKVSRLASERVKDLKERKQEQNSRRSSLSDVGRSMSNHAEQESHSSKRTQTAATDITEDQVAVLSLENLKLQRKIDELSSELNVLKERSLIAREEAGTDPDYTIAKPTLSEYLVNLTVVFAFAPIEIGQYIITYLFRSGNSIHFKPKAK
ncbi:hypothetical protein MP638_000139 [Amoeboaphelidium occidentale]|nr:hypothetical protein MP638_000139 [Amoeboaphelidium occidentale]